jgi:beta-lactamase superfamily II metal-dependent hydrolase
MTSQRNGATLGIEIDFLPVGDGESSGDAIAVRWGNLYGSRSEQVVVIVDGGFSDDGVELVTHLDKYYGTDTVDIVISTHPDNDHANGLRVVLEKLSVGQLWMHLPWDHSPEIQAAKAMGFRSPRILDKFEQNMAAAANLEDIAGTLGIPIIEPFAGTATPDGVLQVLSPTREYYRRLLGEVADSEKGALSSALSRAGALLSAAAQHLVPEDLNRETLTDWGDTTPQNNSSVIALIRYDSQNALLTADAGMPPLGMVADILEVGGIAPGGLSFMQVPHHGSRRNVGPTVLTRILGEKGRAEKNGTAFVSAAKDSPKHPAKKVTNAFLRRGYPVHGTEGQKKWHYKDAPARDDYTTSTAYPLHGQVPDDEG